MPITIKQIIKDKTKRLVKYPPTLNKNCVNPFSTERLINDSTTLTIKSTTSKRISPPQAPFISAPLSVMCRVKNAPISKNSHHSPCPANEKNSPIAAKIDLNALPSPASIVMLWVCANIAAAISGTSHFDRKNNTKEITVIGAHAGAGTIALFHKGKKR